MATLHQRSFSSGELAPAVQARVDTSKYQAGLKTCRNFMIMRHGGATSRPGTTYITEVKDSSAATRLIPFVFNISQTYVLEFGNLYMRIIKNGVPLTISAPTAWSSATAYKAGNLASLSGVNYYCKQSHSNHTPPNTTYWYALTGSIFEIPTVYTTSDLPQVQFVQSADVMTFVHPSYPVQSLNRYGDTNWTFGPMAIGANQSVPALVQINSMTAGSTYSWSYRATGIGDPNSSNPLERRESLPGPVLQIVSGADISQTNVPQFDVTGGRGAGSTYTDQFGNSVATSFNTINFYKEALNGDYGYIGTMNYPWRTYLDGGVIPDTSQQPPGDRNPFVGAGNYPSCVAYSQQRLVFAASNNQPETIWTSKTGAPNAFWAQNPLTDADAITATVVGRQVNAVTHLLDLGNLLAFTSAGELSITGDANGVLKPSAFNVKTEGAQGSSILLPPLVVSNNAIYVQARGSVVRDLYFQFQFDGYRGDEISIYSSHLLEGYTLVDWCYQQIPNSIVWAVRSDGVLLGLTYIKEQQIIAWHRHDYDGIVERVCSIPEGSEDAVYLVVKRTINGVTKRYIERMGSRFLTTSTIDYVGVDCSLYYDGRSSSMVSPPTMTLSGGTSWAYTETLTLTASAAQFASGDIGKQVILTGSDGSIVRFNILGFTSSTVVTGSSDRTVALSLRSLAASSFSIAVKTVSGLSHLEGKTVSILADGYVVGSPNNSNYPTYQVASGSVTLDQCYSVVRVGLPITCDLETLSVDTAQGESIVDKSKITTELTLTLEKSRGLFAGQTAPSDNGISGLTEMKIREYEGYDSPVSLVTDIEEVTIAPTWNQYGRVFLRQVDPLPLTILSVAADGLFPFKNGG